jgi:hypothetical protein
LCRYFGTIVANLAFCRPQYVLGQAVPVFAGKIKSGLKVTLCGVLKNVIRT